MLPKHSLALTACLCALVALPSLASAQIKLNQDRPASSPAKFLDPLKLPAKIDYADDRIVVTFASNAAPAARARLIQKYGLNVDNKVSNAHFVVLLIPKDALNAGASVEKLVVAINNEPTVFYAEFDPIITPDLIPNDTRFNEMWGLHNTGQTGGTNDADIDAPEAWDIAASHPSITVAVCDDGVDWNHPDLNDNIWLNMAEVNGVTGIDDDGNGYIDDYRGWDFASGDNNPAPGGSHGTHVAGTIGAEFNNNQGVTGVGPNIKIMPLRHYSGQSTWMSALASAIDYAWYNGAKVINVSYNIDSYTQALVDAIKRAETADVVYCNSAGNNNQNNPPRQAIRNLASNVVFVASTDHNDNKSSFSNYGTLVEIGAPGSNILSTLPSNSYGNNSGTSMAAPHMAGCVGVVRAMNPGLTARQALDLLIGTADSKPQLTSFIPGGKRVNLNAALETDTTPPADITGLTIVQRANTAARFQMVATGDDGLSGQASSYDLRVSTSPITSGNFTSAKQLNAAIPAVNGGTVVQFTANGFWPGEVVYIAIRAADNLGNLSGITTFGPFSTRNAHWSDRVEGPDQFTPSAPWGKTNVNPSSGSFSWTDSPTGNYANNANTSLTQTNAVVVPTNSGVKFDARFDLENNRDYVYVEASINGGAYQVTGSLTGVQPTWKAYTFSLPASPGDSVRVRFRLVSDGSAVRDGIYIDDIAIVPIFRPFFDNVEGSPRFTGQNPWAVVTTQSFSPVSSWHDSPAGNYTNNLNIALTGNSDTNVTSIANPTLIFKSRFDLETNYDYVHVEVSGNSGGTWTSLGTLNGTVPTWSAYGYQIANMDNVRLRFRLTTDGSVVRDGIYLDDIEIFGEPWETVAVIQGELTLERFLGSPSTRTATIEIRDAGGNTTLETQVVPLFDTGLSTKARYLVVTPQIGSKDVYYKVPGYLRRKVNNVNVSQGMANVNASLIIGDCNGDNVINNSDVLIQRNAYLSGPGDTRWDPRADVNGDNYVDALDLRWTWLNRGTSGD